MTTTVTKTIGTSSRDYSTLAGWMAACPASLVSADQIWRGEGYNDSVFTGEVDIAGVTTSSTQYIILTTATGQSFIDASGVLTNAFTYNNTKGCTQEIFGGSGSAMRLTVADCIVEKWQISATVSIAVNQNASNTNVTVRNCILLSGNSTTGSGPLVLQGGTAINCLVICNNGGTVNLSGNNSIFRNVTAVQTGSAGAWAFRGNYDNPLYLNCIGFGSGTGFRSGTSGSSNYNATFDTSAPGTNSVQSLTASAQFQNVTTDFRIKAGNSLQAGTRDNTYTNDLDIVGQTRSTTTPTMGCWEYVSAGGGASFLPYNTVPLTGPILAQ